jgi:hypothetical protein
VQNKNPTFCNPLGPPNYLDSIDPCWTWFGELGNLVTQFKPKPFHPCLFLTAVPFFGHADLPPLDLVGLKHTCYISGSIGIGPEQEMHEISSADISLVSLYSSISGATEHMSSAFQDTFSAVFSDPGKEDPAMFLSTELLYKNAGRPAKKANFLAFRNTRKSFY